MLGSLRRVWRLIWKELLITLGIPSMRAILIVPPVLQLLVYAYAASLEVTNVRLGVFNLDSGVEAASFFKAFAVEPVFREVVYYRSYEEVKDAIERREIFAALIAPEDFSQKFLAKGETADLQLLVDGRRANASAILSGYVSQIVQTYGIKATVQSAGGSLDTATLGPVFRRWFNPNLISRNAFMPGLICLLTTTVGIMVSALSISRERETGTFEQLLVSPAAPMEIVAGKAIASVLLATGSVLLVTSVVVFGFKLPLQGPFWLMILTSTLYLTSIVGIGLLISALSTTQQQSTLGVFLFMPPAIMLGGFVTPFENMPYWLKTLTVGNPVRWEIEIMKGIFLRGSQTDVIAPRLAPLAIVAAISLFLACYMFKRRME